jgi:hypothetical protein
MTAPVPDPARSRFIAIQAIRWSGLALVLFGLLVIYRRIDLPVEAGYALFVVGVLDALIMPSVLTKLWKSPPQ